MGLLVNTLAADEKYSVLNRDNLTTPIEMQSKSSLNVEHFKKKDDPHRFCISEIRDSENVVR